MEVVQKSNFLLGRFEAQSYSLASPTPYDSLSLKTTEILQCDRAYSEDHIMIISLTSNSHKLRLKNHI